MNNSFSNKKPAAACFMLLAIPTLEAWERCAVPNASLTNTSPSDAQYAALPTIKYITDQGGKAILFSHLGRIKTEEDKEICVGSKIEPNDVPMISEETIPSAL